MQGSEAAHDGPGGRPTVAHQGAAAPWTALVTDSLFLSAIVVLSTVLYVGRLGFYSDDWSFLVYFSLADDQSLGGLVRSVHSPHTAMRPVQLLYLAWLYRLFGDHPLGYHLVNAAVIVLVALLFHVVLRELRQPRALALAVPLVYALLPHYSTDRFWYAAFKAPLSMLLYFASLYADLRALHTSGGRLWAVKLVSLICLVASGLAYEVVLPLFVLNLGLLWWRDQGSPDRWRSARVAVIYGTNLVALLAVALFKLSTTTRAGSTDLTYRITWFLRLNREALETSYGAFGVALPQVLWTMVAEYGHGLVIALGTAAGVLVYLHLERVTRRSADAPTAPQALTLTVAGFTVFGLGHAIFVTNFNAYVSATGISNRIAIASAAGVALSFVGLAAFGASLVPGDRLRRATFSLLVAFLCASGVVMNYILADFWAAAYLRQREILADLRQQFPTLREESTVILDGVCPYVGPAVVFESNWDLAGAIGMLYGDHSLRADVVTPRLSVDDTGLTTDIYGGNRSHYPYGDRLFVYHAGRREAHRLTDAEVARRYFDTVSPEFGAGCPPGEPGFGVAVLRGWR